MFFIYFSPAARIDAPASLRVLDNCFPTAQSKLIFIPTVPLRLAPDKRIPKQFSLRRKKRTQTNISIDGLL
jgi:hypothetical protein